MNKQKTRERIILTVKEAISNNLYFVQDNKHPDEYDAVIDSNDVDHIAEQSAEELIEAGYGDTKQAVREFAEDFIEEIKDRIKGLNVFLDDECRYILEETLDYMDELLAEVIGE